MCMEANTTLRAAQVSHRQVGETAHLPINHVLGFGNTLFSRLIFDSPNLGDQAGQHGDNSERAFACADDWRASQAIDAPFSLSGASGSIRGARGASAAPRRRGPSLVTAANRGAFLCCIDGRQRHGVDLHRGATLSLIFPIVRSKRFRRRPDRAGLAPGRLYDRVRVFDNGRCCQTFRPV
jgi:hypothetical protein